MTMFIVIAAAQRELKDSEDLSCLANKKLELNSKLCHFYLSSEEY